MNDRITEITLGKAVTRDLAAIGVQNKFDRMIFSSSTLCSFSTAMAFMTVFPVPMCAINVKYYDLFFQFGAKYILNG